jgi:5-methylcytosine-specific restriction protein A
MQIREALKKILDNISRAREEPLADHHLAQLITDDWQAAVADVVDDPSYKVVGSPGKGVWARTVWLSIFDRMITESAQRGFYLVYLIPTKGDKAFLSLNQGTEEIYRRVGGQRYREVLEDTAARDRGLLDGEETYGLQAGPIDLHGGSRLTRGYESGNIFAIEYSALDLTSEAELEADLNRLLLLYQSLIEARDQIDEEAKPKKPKSKDVDQLEASRYRWHKRAERSRGLAREAKEFHGVSCQVQACGKVMKEIYGDLAADYIEAHHLTPFAQLEGRPTKLDPRTDFAVVCPDCHRMIHKRTEPYSLQEISDQIVLLKSQRLSETKGSASKPQRPSK